MIMGQQGKGKDRGVKEAERCGSPVLNIVLQRTRTLGPMGYANATAATKLYVEALVFSKVSQSDVFCLAS